MTFAVSSANWNRMWPARSARWREVFDNANNVLSPENRQQFSELLRNANGVAIYIVKISVGSPPCSKRPRRPSRTSTSK